MQSQKDNLYQKVFLEVANTIINFINQSEQIYERQRESEQVRYIAKVCNAIMGVGKSTAVQLITKMAIEIGGVPLLCVFNNNDTMYEFQREVEGYFQHVDGKLLVVNTENFNEALAQNVKHYQVVAITHQRLRDMKVHSGGFANFSNYIPKEGWIEPLKRTIIIDEKPIFINDEIFDIGSENNCLDWFDTMVKRTNLNDHDIVQFRAIIPFLVASEGAELCREEGSNSVSTAPLIRHIKYDRSKYNLINNVMNQLKGIKVSPEINRRFNWFHRLLYDDKVGIVIESNQKNQILCSEWIDYKTLGNVLILDGTADIIKTIYAYGGYSPIVVENPHRYRERLSIHFREVNTSKSNKDKDKVINTISRDVRKLCQKQKIFLLPFKDQIKGFVKTNAITQEEYDALFKGRKHEHDTMALNLFNTVGKNDLANYDALALSSLPIRNPYYYQKYALAIYGIDSDVSLFKGKKKTFESQWFKGKKVQNLFEELVLAELSQIIHRTSLRHINRENLVHIYLYTHRVEWIKHLKEIFSLGNENIKLTQLQKEENFKDKCLKELTEALKYMRVQQRNECSPGQISRRFKDWLNRNWKNEMTRKIIENVCDEVGLLIEENNYNQYKKLYLLK